MSKFIENVTFNGRELTIVGEYDIRREVVDHVGWLQNGEVREQDIFGYVVKEQDIEVNEIWEERKGREFKLEKDEFSHDDLLSLYEIVADVLTENHTD